MKSGSGTKNSKIEDDIMKITVVINRCNDKETHDTNGSISSVSDSKEEATDDKCVRKKLEISGNCERPRNDRRGLEDKSRKGKLLPGRKQKGKPKIMKATRLMNLGLINLTGTPHKDF